MKLSEAVAMYIKLRDTKAQIAAEAKAQIAPIDEKMDKLESKLLEAFDRAGMDSVKTEAGTAYTSVRTTMSVSDRDSFVRHVRETMNLDLLEVRVNKLAAESFLGETGQLPPGIKCDRERTVGVRRSS